MQLRELREYAERRGWQVAGEYVDWGVTGSKESQPQLNAAAHRRALYRSFRSRTECSIS